MTTKYTYIADLMKLVDIPVDGILSRTLYHDERVKAVLFGFAADQELSAHAAPMPTILHLIQGEASLTLGEDVLDAHAGAWVYMPPQLQHSISAKTPVVMLLLMLKTEKQGG